MENKNAPDDETTVTVLSVGVLIRRGYEHFRRREVKKTAHSATTVDARDATKGVSPTYVGLTLSSGLRIHWEA